MPQKRIPWAFEVPQLTQRMARVYASGARRAVGRKWGVGGRGRARGGGVAPGYWRPSTGAGSTKLAVVPTVRRR
ncbi:hypothetical protein BH23DEI1_BH23DEI1_18150 [soil metagenome]